MRRLVLMSVSALGLAACAAPHIAAIEGAEDQPELSCLTAPGCNFSEAPVSIAEASPVRIAPRPYPFFPTEEQLVFVDSRGQSWIAPIRTLTDGASIPPIFISIVGEPRSPEFLNAATVHDAYCGIGNEKGDRFQAANWEDVHIMFYDALIAGGTQQFTAKLMFAAVWLGGPRWPSVTQDVGAVVSSQGGVYDDRFDLAIKHAPDSELRKALIRTKVFIANEQPTLPHLLAFLRREEQRLIDRYHRYDNDVLEVRNEVVEEEEDEIDPPTTGDEDPPTTGDGDPPTTGDGDPPTTGDGDPPTTGDGDAPATGDGDPPTTGAGDPPTSVEDPDSTPITGTDGDGVVVVIGAGAGELAVGTPTGDPNNSASAGDGL